MQGIDTIIEILMIVVAVTVFVGLSKPWVVLWWSDFANRLKVLEIYGSLLLGLFVAYWLLKLLA